MLNVLHQFYIIYVASSPRVPATNLCSLSQANNHHHNHHQRPLMVWWQLMDHSLVLGIDKTTWCVITMPTTKLVEQNFWNHWSEYHLSQINRTTQWCWAKHQLWLLLMECGRSPPAMRILIWQQQPTIITTTKSGSNTVWTIVSYGQRNAEKCENEFVASTVKWTQIKPRDCWLFIIIIILVLFALCFSSFVYF